MRFITEFEIMEHEKKEYRVSDRKKAYYEPRFAKKIIDAFGWQNPIEGDWRHYKLEIEAFPMEKWIEFKEQLFMECGMPEPSGVAILEMIKDLEFYSKNNQSVDAITNQQLNK